MRKSDSNSIAWAARGLCVNPSALDKSASSRHSVTSGSLQTAKLAGKCPGVPVSDSSAATPKNTDSRWGVRVCPRDRHPPGFPLVSLENYSHFARECHADEASHSKGECH